MFSVRLRIAESFSVSVAGKVFKVELLILDAHFS